MGDRAGYDEGHDPFDDDVTIFDATIGQQRLTDDVRKGLDLSANQSRSSPNAANAGMRLRRLWSVENELLLMGQDHKTTARVTLLSSAAGHALRESC